MELELETTINLDKLEKIICELVEKNVELSYLGANGDSFYETDVVSVELGPQGVKVTLDVSHSEGRFCSKEELRTNAQSQLESILN